ncbi:hypothetical protein SAMN02745121_08494 [Nannocystis exedens]|uniref:Uncharacterized protein n=1 Tax=Nannocystis exedens TaxID=54 RepID=A0A1I2IC95_9BACT|nr:hypothetical protein [Nannocystis exedens]PCC74123.1 hypothetical protein NAEX_07212 [Nannocystis exedens]SFF38141.1 hypothetical protein SAMN02745121_08494 [Nannocystis exedens]
MARRDSPPLHTPDGRYIVVRGRLWRAANPSLAADVREALVRALMTARRDVRRARADGDAEALRAARARVHAAKIGLGERGPVWWTDGAPDLGRHEVQGTQYAEWYRAQESSLARPDDPPIQIPGVT